MSNSTRSNSSSAPLQQALSQPNLDAEITLTKARRTLLNYAKYISPPEYHWGRHHAVMYPLLDRFIDGTIKRLIIEEPPRHGKSEAASRNTPSKAFGTYPDLRIIACSYGQDLASEMNRDVQRIMDGPRYAELFPDIALSETNVRAMSGKARRNSDVFDIPGHRGFYKAAGVGGSIGGWGFDRGIIDDPFKNREDANSPIIRESTWRWFTSTFMTRMAKGAGILITTTRWHEDDLAGRIKRKMAAGEIEPYTILTLPAIATDTPSIYDWRKPGEALWPWFKTAAEFEMMRRTEPRDFYALQQQDPRGEGASEWGPDCFPSTMWFDDWPKDIQLLTVGLDPSKGREASHGDYSALVALGRTKDGTLWVEADLGRWNSSQIVAQSVEFVERIQKETGKAVDGFGVESDQFQELLADQIMQATRTRWLGSIIRKMTTEGVPKAVRIRRLTPELTAGKLRFRATQGTRLLVRQLEQFPHADHDDGPDALEYARRLAIWCWNGKAKK